MKLHNTDYLYIIPMWIKNHVYESVCDCDKNKCNFKLSDLIISLPSILLIRNFNWLCKVIRYGKIIHYVNWNIMYSIGDATEAGERHGMS